MLNYNEVILIKIITHTPDFNIPKGLKLSPFTPHTKLSDCHQITLLPRSITLKDIAHDLWSAQACD